MEYLQKHDEVKMIFMVYWSIYYDMPVARVLIKRPESKGDLGRRRYSDILAKIPLIQLKERTGRLFTRFLTKLMKDEIRRQERK